jgi:hypothetical protein
MKLLGFNFTKILAEKKSTKIENLKIDQNIHISNILQSKSSVLKTKEDVLTIEFSYTIKYNEYATIDFSGNMIISVDSKIAKNVLKEWKNKKMPEDFQMAIYNTIIMKSNVRALGLEDELNLPYHVPMPRLQPPQKKTK